MAIMCRVLVRGGRSTALDGVIRYYEATLPAAHYHAQAVSSMYRRRGVRWSRTGCALSVVLFVISPIAINCSALRSVSQAWAAWGGGHPLSRWGQWEFYIKGVDPGGVAGILTPSWKYVEGVRVCFDPLLKMSHSLIQNCCCITLQVSHHLEEWKICVKTRR